ncbi:MAG: hypothetical protein JKX99_08750, partial [Robiginitomaculum sp.]|nr:hypothetical protein [Robiginitomaculum sp.]
MDQRSPYPATYDNPNALFDDNAFDLRHLLTIFRRRFRLFIAVALIVLAIVVLVAFQLTPRFSATAQL